MKNQNDNAEIITGPTIVGSIVVNKGGSGDPLGIRVVLKDVEAIRISDMKFSKWMPQDLPPPHNGKYPTQADQTVKFHFIPAKDGPSCGTEFKGPILLPGILAGTPSGHAYNVDILYQPGGLKRTFTGVQVYLENNWTDKPPCPPSE